MSFFNRRTDKGYRLDEELELDEDEEKEDAAERDAIITAMTEPHVSKEKEDNPYDEDLHWADVAVEAAPVDASTEVSNLVDDPPDEVVVKWIGHLERDDGRLIVATLEHGTHNTVTDIFLVDSENIILSHAILQELPLDVKMESVYNDLVKYVNNQVPGISTGNLNYVLLQFLNRAVCFLPDELTPQKLDWINRRLSKRNIQL